jgi:hypothetical protein
MPRDRLEEAVDQLHVDTLDAIRRGDPQAYRDNVQAYERMLLAFPRAWHEYRQAFVPELAGGLGMLERSPIQAVVGNLYSEFRTVIAGNDFEIARRAVSLPEVVARGAIRLGATALLGMMVDLLAFGYVTALQSPSTAGRRTFQERTVRAISDLYRQIDFSLQEAIGKLDATEPLFGSLTVLFSAIRRILKELIDIGEVSAIKAIDEEWNSMLGELHPELIGPSKEVIEALRRQYSSDDPRLVDVERRSEYREVLAREKDELEKQRRLFKLELCSWALHSLRGAAPGATVSSSFRYFADQFTNPSDLEKLVGLALDVEFQDRLLLSNWLLEELPEGKAHFIGTDIELLRTYLVISVLRVNPSETLALEPAEWVRSHFSQMETLAGELKADTALWAILLPQNLVADRFERLFGAVRNAVRRQEELEAINVQTSPLDPARVELFKSSLRATWLDNRLACSFFRIAGAYDEVVQELQPASLLFGTSVWLPKEGFTADPRVIGIEGVAGTLGMNLADSEMARLIRELDDVTISTSSAGGTLRNDLLLAKQGLENEKYQPLIALIPLDWRLTQSLGFERLGLQEDAAPSSWHLPKGVQNTYVGKIHNLAVFRHHRIPKDRICILDVRAFGRWRQFRSQADHEWLTVTIEAFDEAKAHELAQKQPSLFSDKDAPLELRAGRIRGQVLLTYTERFVIENKDPLAGRWIVISQGRQASSATNSQPDT